MDGAVPVIYVVTSQLILRHRLRILALPLKQPWCKRG
jgi:hypothetical protein